jgi:glycosyltransferase involved in cell wall biosynthesis
MKKPLVSVVMPTLNSERYVREALHSLASQTYAPFEVIIVDGGSTDRTLAVIGEYALDGDLRVIRSEPGKGMGYDLNLGLAECRGAYIARMDADDIAHARRLRDQVEFLVAYPMVDVVGGGADLFWHARGTQRGPLRHDGIRDTYLLNNPFFHPTIMFRRSLVERGLYRYDEDFYADEDYELWGRLIPKVICANMDQSLIRYRIHEGNGQREPWKFRHKRKALTRFCEAEGIYRPDLVDALTEFQCSQFVTPSMYEAMSAYARLAQEEDSKQMRQNGAGMPKLGWIQGALVEKKNYGEFMEWYCTVRGWG